MPVCKKCGVEKPESEFNYSDRKSGKRQSICRKCCSEYNRLRYQSDPDRFREGVKRYRREHPAECFKTRLKAWEKSPSRYNLRKLTEAAIASGVITKPDRCQVCGKVPRKRIEAHHEDYSKPLDVIWCCTSCHDKLDMKRRIREGKQCRPRMTGVRCVETGSVYESAASAARAVGLKTASSIFAVLSGSAKTAGGFRWERAE